MFRTSIPFGYLIFFIFLLATFLTGVGLFLAGGRRRSRPARWFGGVLVAAAVVACVFELTLGSALEWNPIITEDTQLIGLWNDGEKSLMLTPEHTFVYERDGLVTRGTWTRSDWNLDLRGDTYSGRMRFVQDFGKLRLITHPPEDPDLWDGDLGLKKARP